VGQAHDSLICPGCIVSGGQVRNSILSHNVRVNSYAHIDDSILFEGVDVGRHSTIRRAIIDKGVHIPPESEIGIDQDADRARGWKVTESGVTVLSATDQF
jgi:glucose-1-phosphate adenylyltransferase